MLFRRFESWGLLERSIVVIVGDHGESFGEHYNLGHGNGAYEPENRIPLIIRLPGQNKGQRISQTVHLVDVMPTILKEMKLVQPVGLEGNSLWNLPHVHTPITYTGRFPDLAEKYPQFYDRTHYAVYNDPWKLILRSDGDAELYDIYADPDELYDQASKRPDLVGELTHKLLLFKENIKPRFSKKKSNPDPDLLERLRVLGYIQ
jgi:arylsulfatase A-like enzyme